MIPIRSLSNSADFILGGPFWGNQDPEKLVFHFERKTSLIRRLRPLKSFFVHEEFRESHGFPGSNVFLGEKPRIWSAKGSAKVNPGSKEPGFFIFD
jgi:hypothetical protein